MSDHNVADAQLLLQKCISLNIRKYFQRRWKRKDNHPYFRPRLGYYHPSFEGISIWATPPSGRTNCHRSQIKHFQIHIGYTLNWQVLIRHVQRINTWIDEQNEWTGRQIEIQVYKHNLWHKDVSLWYIFAVFGKKNILLILLHGPDTFDRVCDTGMQGISMLKPSSSLKIQIFAVASWRQERIIHGLA